MVPRESLAPIHAERAAAKSMPVKEEGAIRRPWSITIIGWIFIATGCVTFVAGVVSLFSASESQHSGEIGLVLLIRILAVLGGVFLLSGLNWARWLIVVWLGYHVVLSVGHPLFELIVHSLLAAAIIYYLFRPPAAAYFEGGNKTVADSKG